MRLLAFMAHPDDAEILAGGTLLELHARGWEVGIATMTSGDCGSATLSREEIAAVRAREAAEAARFVGGWYRWAGLYDAEVFTNADNVRRTAEVLRAFDPDVVITHSPVDYMVDHEEASRLVRAAAFTAAMPLYRTLQPQPAAIARATPALYYADAVEGVGPVGERISPDFYVDVTASMERKREMLACHDSQRAWLRAHHGMDEYLDRMTAWAAAFGAECGCRFAEGLRQHLGHGYPHEPRIQEALGPLVRRVPRAPGNQKVKHRDTKTRQ
jgi:LmbE family N-acetylglucosaminyl deacetylase